MLLNYVYAYSTGTVPQRNCSCIARRKRSIIKIAAQVELPRARYPIRGPSSFGFQFNPGEYQTRYALKEQVVHEDGTACSFVAHSRLWESHFS